MAMLHWHGRRGGHGLRGGGDGVLSYPQTLTLERSSLWGRLRVTDASGQLVRFVKQEPYSAAEWQVQDVRVFEDEGEQRPVLRIWTPDTSAFSDGWRVDRPDGSPLGWVKRSSRQTSTAGETAYYIADADDVDIGHIDFRMTGARQIWHLFLEDPVKKLPFGGALTNRLFRSTYSVSMRGAPAFDLYQERSFTGGTWTLERRPEAAEQDEELVLAGVAMLALPLG